MDLIYYGDFISMKKIEFKIKKMLMGSNDVLLSDFDGKQHHHYNVTIEDYIKRYPYVYSDITSNYLDSDGKVIDPKSWNWGDAICSIDPEYNLLIGKKEKIAKLRKVYLCKNNRAGYFVCVYDHNVIGFYEGGSGRRVLSKRVAVASDFRIY